MQSSGGWGPWQLDRDVRALRMGDTDYEVDLDRCLTSAETLDWILQVADKADADDATIAGLVRALTDVLDPQATLCSGGRSRRLTMAQVAELVRRAPDRGW
jgi:ABC-type transport system involved in cytochrome c biogenesis ATPase subunit